MRLEKRGQAALEFLASYGWSILVIALAAGSLAFYGFFDIGSGLPESCFLGSGFHCKDYKVSAKNGISMNVINNLGKDLAEFVVTIDGNSFNETCVGQSGFVRSLFGGGGTPFPKQPDGVTSIGVFKDGQTGSVTTIFNTSTGLPNGYFCGNNDFSDDSVGDAMCCSQINVYHGNPSYPFKSFCPEFDPLNNIGTSCKTSETKWLNQMQGENFDRGLIIVYNIVGSSIYHKRKGTLRTVVE